MAVRSQTQINIVVAGGGTGGHLFPGLATAEALTVLEPRAKITFVGTGRPGEARALAGKPYEYRVLPAPRLERSLHPANVVVPVRLIWALTKARRLLRDLDTALVIGTGGYGSAPVLLAARRRRIPTVILEQNIIPGLTNRLLSRLADLVCLTFEPSRDWLATGTEIAITGNPIREVRDVDDVAGARARLGLDAGRFTVFVFGGSQGARRLVLATREALAAWTEADLQLVVQTGTAAALEAPEEWKGRLLVRPFFDDIYDCYRAADLVVGRAGGGVAEILAFGRPMVLVPYPYAARGHQLRNASYIEQEGAAIVVEDAEFDGALMADLVLTLRRDTRRRETMARASRELGRPRAARQVARKALALLGLNV